jgi:hypothetical protein
MQTYIHYKGIQYKKYKQFRKKVARFFSKLKLKASKGIVSRDFCVLFLIYLDRYEVPYRAGSGLFFILKRSSYLNF